MDLLLDGYDRQDLVKISTCELFMGHHLGIPVSCLELPVYVTHGEGAEDVGIGIVIGMKGYSFSNRSIRGNATYIAFLALYSFRPLARYS
jgi:hypothetical protein